MSPQRDATTAYLVDDPTWAAIAPAATEAERRERPALYAVVAIALCLALAAAWAWNSGLFGGGIVTGNAGTSGGGNTDTHIVQWDEDVVNAGSVDNRLVSVTSEVPEVQIAKATFEPATLRPGQRGVIHFTFTVPDCESARSRPIIDPHTLTIRSAGRFGERSTPLEGPIAASLDLVIDMACGSADEDPSG